MHKSASTRWEDIEVIGWEDKGAETLTVRIKQKGTIGTCGYKRGFCMKFSLEALEKLMVYVNEGEQYPLQAIYSQNTWSQK